MQMLAFADAFKFVVSRLMTRQMFSSLVDAERLEGVVLKSPQKTLYSRHTVNKSLGILTFECDQELLMGDKLSRTSFIVR